jgi:apolipoprotein N-acyltransferase
MDPELKAWQRIAAPAAAILLAGAAFYLGGGLNPPWWAMWVAALPVLWLAPRCSWRAASLVALAARFLGGLSMWSYFHQLLRMPFWLCLELVLLPALVFTLAVLLFRSFFRRGQVWIAVLSFPSLNVLCEYGRDLAFGTFANLAYTQLNNLPVLQLAAVTGLWGISFVVSLFASALAAIILSRGATRRRLALVLAAAIVGVLGYGVLRLRATPASSPVIPVGLVSTEFPQNVFASTDAQKTRLLQEYAAQAGALAARGARIVVLPEMSVLVSGALSDDADRLFEQTARQSGAQVLLGVLHQTPAGTFNEARLYSPSGTVRAVYRKHHLVPVAEGGTTPATGISVLDEPAGRLGLEICRDMDYPDPACLYGRSGVGLLLVPAWDFNLDRWWHGHMALMRGVEYGFSVVRSAKVGFLTVADDRGRVLAEASTAPTVPFTTLLADVPMRHDATLYLRFGDWFAWLNLALFCVLLALRLATRLPPAPPAYTAPGSLPGPETAAKPAPPQ